MWRKREEGLEVTAKGAKDLAGGRRLHVVVAIAYGKGVILKVPYEKMTGRFFSQFVREHFNRTFAEAGVRFSKDPKTSRARKRSRKAPETAFGCFSKRTRSSGPRKSRHFFP